MNRFFSIAIFGVASVVAANAGPITYVPTPLNLGTDNDAAVGTPVYNKKLTSYIPACTTICPPGPATTTFTGVQSGSTPVPFYFAGTAVNDIWAPSNTAGTQSVTMDVGGYSSGGAYNTGIFGVDQIWTMINDVYGSEDLQGISLVLTGASSTGAPVIETINLVDGVDYRALSTNYSVNCDVAGCGNGTGSGTDPGTGANEVTSSVAGVAGSAGATVTVDNSVIATNNASNPNYWMDVQDITLGSAFVGGYLDTIQIESKDGAAGTAEKAILTAVTVDAQTPEPASVFLFATGISGLALWRRRSLKQS